MNHSANTSQVVYSNELGKHKIFQLVDMPKSSEGVMMRTNLANGSNVGQSRDYHPYQIVVVKTVASWVQACKKVFGSNTL